RRVRSVSRSRAESVGLCASAFSLPYRERQACTSCFTFFRDRTLAGCGKTKDRSMRHASLNSSQEVGMRGESIPDDMFSYIRPEQRVPLEHPLRPLRTLVDDVLRTLSPRFARQYAQTGRPSIPPEHLLRALLLQTL